MSRDQFHQLPSVRTLVIGDIESAGQLVDQGYRYLQFLGGLAVSGMFSSSGLGTSSSNLTFCSTRVAYGFYKSQAFLAPERIGAHAGLAYFFNAPCILAQAQAWKMFRTTCI